MMGRRTALETIGEKAGIYGVIVIHLKGDLYFPELLCVRERVLSFLSAGYKNIVVNMTHVDHVNPMAIGIFVELLKIVRKVNGEMKLAGMTPYVRQIFCAVGMGQYFEQYCSVDEALESFGEEWAEEMGAMQ